MFSRYVKSDGTVTAIYPFQRLAHQISISVPGIFPFDAAKEKEANKTLRSWLHDFKEKVWEHVDKNNKSAVRKAQHYIDALEHQLQACDKTDRLIDSLVTPFPKMPV